MSLINKMLQDLDARGSQGGEGMQSSIKSVARPERSTALPLVGGALVGLAVLGAAGYYGWQYWKRSASAPVAVAQKVVPAPVSKPIVAAPVAAPVAAAPAVSEAAVPAQAVPEGIILKANRSVPAKAAPEAPVEEPVKPAKVKVAKKDKAAKAGKSAKDSKHAKAAKVKAAPAAASEAPVAANGLTSSQKAESEYRRALASLQEGRVPEAMAALEQALQANPRHDAARQTLVGLLVEGKRNDDAIKVLQAGLALNAQQPSLAMLLARLQIQRGESGIETLQKSLPAAAGNAEYHAFLAGALQRAERHREAAEQYEAALRASPSNGVWWMGLGLSLQAEKRNAEAIAAFERARDSGKLSVPLLTFVERRLQQLGK